MSTTLTAPPSETPATETPAETPVTPIKPPDDTPPPETPAEPVPLAAEKEATKEAVPFDPQGLKLPENSTLDEAAVERTAAFARTLGLSNEQAQAALELASQEAQAALEGRLAAFQPGGAEHVKIVEGWKQETLADAALGKTPEERTAAIQRGHLVLKKYQEQHPEEAQELVTMLNESGYGNHKAVTRLFAWLGKAGAEKPLVFGTTENRKEKPLAQRFYPTMNE